MKCTTVILDLDGTLLDTGEYLWNYHGHLVVTGCKTVVSLQILGIGCAWVNCVCLPDGCLT